MFKSPKIFMQVFRNRIVLVDLMTGHKITEHAVEPFSSVRQTIGNFDNANKTLKYAMKKLSIKKSIFATKVLIQQMEGSEGGLSQIEIRALRDIAELNGADKIYIIEHDKPMSDHEALA